MTKLSAIVMLLALSAELIYAQQCRDNQESRIHSIGSTECVLLTPYYSEPQWATCLTEDYIMRRGDFHCRDPFAIVCWFQCQLETYGLDNGPVYDSCKCSSGETSQPNTEAAMILPPECFSPGGIDCDWYRDCLEQRYPCEGTEDAYAITYAERYCNLFMDNTHQFSAMGRQWVDGVRQCLQLALVPALRPWVSRSCAQLRSEAFDSHPGCYLNPGSGIPSICDLPCSDAWAVFFVVNVIGDAFTSAPIESGIQMLRVMDGCFFASTGCTGIAITALSLAIPGYGRYRAKAELATRVGRYVANILNLDENGIGWFPFYDDNEETERRRRNADPSDTDDDTIMMLIVDLESLRVSPLTNNSQQMLQETVNAFANAVENGQLNNIPVTVNGTEVNLSVSSLGECQDTFCSNSSNLMPLATAPIITPTTENTFTTASTKSVGNGACPTFSLYAFLAYIMLHCFLLLLV